MLAYVPLDLKSPNDRLKSIINDCGIQILLTSKEPLPFLQETKVHTVISSGENVNLSQIEHIPWGKALLNINDVSLPAVTSDDISYILYTSGSTGTPKGIVHTHKSACSFVVWAVNEFKIKTFDILSNHAPFHFDLSILDLFASCLAGAKMIIIPEFLKKFPTSVTKLIVSENISVWYSVPSALVQMLQRGKLSLETAKSLRVVLFAGEIFPLKSLQFLRNIIPNASVSNLYGPTETNVCTYYTLNQSKYFTNLPIGKACTGFYYKILDESDNEVPADQQGELAVYGPHVMKEYWNRKGLNSKAFIDINGHQYYRTGDYVKTLTDGNLAYLGRKDRQVKLRGFRVELDEIEHILQNVTGVEEGVIVVTGTGSTASLKAVLTQDNNVVGKLSEKEVLIQMAKVLPPYAIPSEIQVLSDLPRTLSGKINRKELV